MTLHSNIAERARLVTHDKNICPQCSAWLMAPDWSEYLNERCVRHSWSCDTCGYAFETSVYFPALQQTAA
jgi:ribosomal protein L37AE/L43A